MLAWRSITQASIYFSTASATESRRVSVTTSVQTRHASEPDWANHLHWSRIEHSGK